MRPDAKCNFKATLRSDACIPPFGRWTPASGKHGSKVIVFGVDAHTFKVANQMDRIPPEWPNPNDFKNSPIEMPVAMAVSPIQRQNTTLRMILPTAAMITVSSGPKPLVDCSFGAVGERKLIKSARIGGRITTGHKAKVHSIVLRSLSRSLINPI
jgi:hypothetical protein